ncbi:MAG: 7-carboxy-7-deazaguanine synthase [Deltaproteobacteria bacterium]|nr:MAG: 7-carboxy-7-deazaguanine synthase [Deltaproteobacteria bacterium]
MISIAEIFYSIQGESTFSGLPCVFVRCAGCNLSCSYCDTGYARDPAAGEMLTVEEVLERVSSFPIDLVEITGGEPLLQPDLHRLIEALLSAGKQVLLETNGSLDISNIDQRVQVVLDVKTPGSGMASKNCMANYQRLDARRHQLKFVLCGEEDFRWSCDFIREYLPESATILFSPVVERFSARRLAELILQEHLPVRLQLQLHRLVWPEAERGK